MSNNIIIGNGNRITNSRIGGNSAICENTIIVNGVRLPNPPTGSHSVMIINDRVYVDGYEFKNGKWKRTLRALWHLLF